MAPSKPRRPRSKPFILGRKRFEAISAVEGITKSAESRRMFEEFDHKGLTPAQRRKAIFEKYAVRAPATSQEQNGWQIAEIQAGLAEADRGDFATEADLASVLDRWRCKGQ